MKSDCRYGFGKVVESGYNDAVKQVEQLLAQHGFGIYSRIDMASVFGPERKLPLKNYQILGACRPDFAEEAFCADHNIGLLLPCNIIIYEEPSGRVTIMAKDPVPMMDLLNDPGAIEAAIKVKEQLEDLMAEL